MADFLTKPCTAFDGHRVLLSGPLSTVTLAVKAALARGATAPLLVFDDATGRVIDIDLREPPIVPAEEGAADEPRGRGRPKLGVIAREVTLLPRHWDWLAAQPGGASVALRKLVEEAKRSGASAEARRAAQEAAYRFMAAMAGDFPGFEEASRALFADDRPGLERQIAPWPEAIRAYLLRLSFG